MLGIFGLTLTMLFITLRFKNLLKRHILPLTQGLNKKIQESNRIQRLYDQIKDENQKLTTALTETLELFDLTKEICSSLEQEKVFGYFKEQLNKKINLNDCLFVSNEKELQDRKDYRIIPIRINHENTGYLLASGITESDENRFFILSHQFMLGIKRAMLYQQVQRLAITDTLTGSLTRRHFLWRCQEEIKRSQKFGYPFSLLMLDIDHFKEINDHYGHLVGDVVLVEVVKCIKKNIREIDSLSRYGGEEFCVLLAETKKPEAKFAAERIRQAVENEMITAYDERVSVTVSIGIASFPEDSQELNTLIDKADTALYQAKQAGRNRVEVYNQEG